MSNVGPTVMVGSEGENGISLHAHTVIELRS
jgi:hypothetical protein